MYVFVVLELSIATSGLVRGVYLRYSERFGGLFHRWDEVAEQKQKRAGCNVQKRKRTGEKTTTPHRGFTRMIYEGTMLLW